MPKEQFDTAFKKFIDQLKLKPKIFDSIEASILKKYHARKQELIQLSIDIHRSIAELKVEQKAKSDAFVAATSPIMRAKLEKEVEDLEAKINAANGESLKIDITEEEIHQFKDHGKKVLEHLSKLLLNVENPRRQLSIFNLIFQGLPTYTEIVNGTPKMALFFGLSAKEYQMEHRVTSPGLSWNTIEYTIKQWTEVVRMINVTY